MDEDTKDKGPYLEGYYAALQAVQAFHEAGHQVEWILEFLRKD